MSSTRRVAVPGALLITALAALMRVPPMHDYAWLILLLILATSFALLALELRARRPDRRPHDGTSLTD